jgi:drug/metabolite transporter (DMT)-like permease
MNSQKTILYIGSIILVIIGAYTVYMGQISQGVIWFILGVIFLSISSQLGRPIKAVKVRKMIILLCAIILLGIGAFMLYFGEFLAGIAWIVAGILGLLISFMLVGHKGVLDPQ